MVDLIDKNGYRANVGIVLMNRQKELFFAKRRYQSGWQFPQGGIHIGETPESAMYRELLEETGLTKNATFAPFTFIIVFFLLVFCYPSIQ